MKIEVLGTGCYNCVKLETLLEAVAQELGRDSFEISRISDEKQILKHMPLDEIPGLLLNGVLVSTRSIPERETLVSWLSAAPEKG